MSGWNRFRNIPLWERVIWSVIVIYLIAVFWVFWEFGFSKVPFPV